METTQSNTLELMTLGKTSLNISPMGIGTWQWGDRYIWGYGQGVYNDEDLQASFNESLAAGINFFDTAEIYGSGRSETLLGRFVKETGQKLVIASKFMPYPWRFSSSQLRRALKLSLARLGMERLSLYQIHWPLPFRSVDTWANALVEVYQEGLVEAVGVSNYNADQMVKTCEILEKNGIPLASNQVRFNLLDRKAQDSGLLATCKKLGVTLIAYSPLSQGLLTGKYTPQNPVKGLRHFQSSVNLETLQPLIGLMRGIGQAHGGKSPSQVALQWVISMGAVPIPGAKNVRQARENAGALGWSLTENEVSMLAQASQKV